MTDMHREAFEKWARNVGLNPAKNLYGFYIYAGIDDLWSAFQAALRYRDEQDWSGTLSCAGCGEPADDPHTFDCPMRYHDEQEKQA